MRWYLYWVKYSIWKQLTYLQLHRFIKWKYSGCLVHHLRHISWNISLACSVSVFGSLLEFKTKWTIFSCTAWVCDNKQTDWLLEVCNFPSVISIEDIRGWTGTLGRERKKGRCVMFYDHQAQVIIAHSLSCAVVWSWRRDHVQRRCGEGRREKGKRVNQTQAV